MNGEIPFILEMHLIDMGILSSRDLETFEAQDDPDFSFKTPVFDEDGQRLVVRFVRPVPSGDTQQFWSGCECS